MCYFFLGGGSEDDWMKLFEDGLLDSLLLVYAQGFLLVKV